MTRNDTCELHQRFRNHNNPLHRHRTDTGTMSKRLNKRQMRELEELQALKAVESSTPRGESEGESEDEEEAAPAFNPFAAVS